MKDMIERLVEIDERSRSITSQLQQDKVNSEHEVKELKEKIRDDYLKRARKRIESNREVEIQKANENFKEIKIDQEEVSKRLEEIYKKNGENFVNEIVRRVLGE